MKTLTLIRGLPGSGKSTLASNLAGSIHVEADMYHVSNDGRYVFDRTRQHDAHDWCQETARVFLRSGRSVVVSNTFTQAWEIQPYADMARDTGSEFKVLETKGNFGSVHNVPKEVIQRMRDRWEDWK